MSIPQVPPSDAIVALVVAVLAALVGWSIVLGEIERRRIVRLARAGSRLVESFGPNPTFTWLRPTAFEVRLSRARRPFRDLRLVLWIQPRRIFPVWLFNLVRGYRDVVGIAADLAVTPTVQIELLDSSTAVGKRALGQAIARGWSTRTVRIGAVERTLATPASGDFERVLYRLTGRLPFEPKALLRLGVHLVEPHLSLSIADPERILASERELATWLKRVADVATVEPKP